MAKPFKGTINVDIRDSAPDWAPFEPPKAPDGAPNVVYIVLDDVGFSAMSCYGGPIETPEHRPDRRRGRALHAVAHDRAVLADPVVPADRPQPHPQQHGLHHRGGDRVPQRQRHDPAGERDALRDPRRARLEHLHGRQVAPVPDRRDEPRLDPAELADRPGLRALLRVPRRGDEPVVSGPRLRQPPGRPAASRPRRATTSPRTSPTRRSSSSRTRRRSRRTSRSSSTTRRAPATRRTTRRRSGSTGTAAGSTWATRRCASRRSPARRRWASSRRTPSCLRSTRSARRDRTGPGRQAVPGAGLHEAVGLALRGREAAVLPDGRGLRGVPRPRRPPHRPAARLPGGDRAAREHADRRRLGQRRQRRGRPERLGQRERSSSTASPTTCEQNLAMLDELGGTKTYNHYPNGWAMAFNTPFKMWKRYEFNGGTADPCIISWPAGTRPAASCATQYHHAIDIVPDGPGRPRRRAAGDDQGARAEPLRRREHALQLRRRRRRRRRGRPSSTRCSAPGRSGTTGWKAITTHPTISGWSHFNDDEWELYHTDVDRVGAARPRRRAARQAARAGEPVVRRGGRQRRVPARRPLGAGDPADAATACSRRRETATSTSRMSPMCPSPRPSTCGTARTRSARWSTSPRRARRVCCSPTGRGSAATPST